MTGSEVAAVGVVTGWGQSTIALPPDAVRAAAGRRVIVAEPAPVAGERFRRATRECLLGVAAVEALLREASLGPEAIRGDEIARVLDVGVGSGAQLVELLALLRTHEHRVRRIELIGLDFMDEFLERANSVLALSSSAVSSCSWCSLVASAWRALRRASSPSAAAFFAPGLVPAF